MNLTAFALRCAAVRMLRGATLAGDRVYDSAILPLDLTKEEAKPTITIAVDEGESKPEGRDVLGAEQQLELVIELVCASAVTVGGGKGEKTVCVELHHTDQGLELILNLMARQIDRAMLTNSPWSDVFKSFVTGIRKITYRRGAGAENGARFAAHQWVYSCSVVAEPSFDSVPPNGHWSRLLSAMRSDPGLSQVADLIELEISSPDLPSWRRAEADLGLKTGHASSIGLGPLNGTDGGQPVTSIDLGGELEATEQAASDQFPEPQNARAD